MLDIRDKVWRKFQLPIITKRKNNQNKKRGYGRYGKRNGRGNPNILTKERGNRKEIEIEEI